MTVRVGIDLVDIQDVRDALDLHGARYLERIYTEREVADCQAIEGVDHRRLAARFAAKEATFKVLRPGERAIPWRAIEVRRDAAGRAELSLTGNAARLAADAGLGELALSISHERRFAAAVVLVQMRAQPAGERPSGIGNAQPAGDRESPTGNAQPTGED